MSEALHAGLEIPPAGGEDDAPAAAGAAPPSAAATLASGLSAAQRKSLLGALPGPASRALAEVSKALGGKGGGVSAFLEAVAASEEVLGAQCAPLEKKKAKARPHTRCTRTPCTLRSAHC